jgi:hypothetical protein
MHFTVVNNSILYKIVSIVENLEPIPWKTEQFIVRESQQVSANLNVGLILKSMLQSTFPKFSSPFLNYFQK